MTISVPILTPEQESNLVNYLGSTKRDYFDYYFDGEFVDDSFELLDFLHLRTLKQELRKSIKSRKCTKKFKTWSKVYDNYDNYVDERVERRNSSWIKDFQVAKRLLVDQVAVKSLQRVKLHLGMETSQIWTRKDASAGIIGLKGDGSKQANEDDCILMALKLEDWIRKGVSFDQIFIPNKSFSRSQMSHYVEGNRFTERKIEYKDRLIWCADGGTESLEASYSQPLIQHLSLYWRQYAGGKDPGKLRNLVRQGRGLPGLSIDYSQFDQTIQSWLIREAFDVIKLFYPVSEHVVLDWICYNFINTWIAMPGRGLKQKHRGIPSGSGFTQLVGSMCNALMFYTYLSKSLNCRDEDKYDMCVKFMTTTNSPRVARNMTCMFMGDDSIIQSRKLFDLKDMQSYMWKVFGVRINKDKCEVWDYNDNPTFLKRVWMVDGEYRSLLEILVNTSHPERTREYLDEDGHRKFSAWHILYGLYVTYNKAFNGISESWLVERMQSFGGLEALKSLDPKDLPGSIRILQMFDPDYLYNRATSVARDMVA